MIELSLALSLHLGLRDNYNPIHPHIRYEDNQFIAGAYYNSLERISLYGGYRLENNDYGLEIGGVTGYDYTIIPYVRGTYKDYFIAPTIEKDRVGIVVGIELRR